MLSLILAERIGSLFIIGFCGFLLVKTGLLKSEQSRTLSVWSIYVLLPCVILNSFRISCTPETRTNFYFSVLAALMVHLIWLIACEILKRVLHLTGVELASAYFPNSANLIIPIVSYILGDEWLIYCNGFICVQMIFMWTYGLSAIKGERSSDLKSLFTSPSIIAIFIGVIFFFLQPPLPAVIDGALSSMTATIGPVSMIMIGMQMASVDFRMALSNRRLYMTVFLRMIFLPGMILPVLKFSGLAALREQGQILLLITLLASCSPCASTIAQLAQIYHKEEEYASLINTVTTLCCIVTMPLMVFLYQL